MWRKIDSDTRRNLKNNAFNWIETYSKTQWAEKPIAEIDESMRLGHVFVVRDTGLNEGWDWNLDSVEKIKIGPSPVEVQGERHTHTYFSYLC